jgi:hypothetical protein
MFLWTEEGVLRITLASTISLYYTGVGVVTPTYYCKIFSKHSNSFVCIWQLVCNHGLIRFKRFVS